MIRYHTTSAKLVIFGRLVRSGTSATSLIRIQRVSWLRGVIDKSPPLPLAWSMLTEHVEARCAALKPQLVPLRVDCDPGLAS